MKLRFERIRYLVAVASVLLTATTIVTLVWAGALTVQFVGDLADDGWRSTTPLVGLLEVIDLLLIATVQVIVAIGLWELFVGELDVPSWLRADSFSDLKSAIAELIVIVIAIKFVEKLAEGTEALDLLYYAAGIAVVGGMLVALSVGKRSGSPKKRVE
jgi:uncharacterized membrane protein YqhA